MANWKIQDAAELYQIDRWSEGYFAADADGRVVVQPNGPDGPKADLYELVARLRRRGMHGPLWQFVRLGETPQ